MLALVGSGEYLPEMENVDCYLLGRLETPARVACLPTAAGMEGKERIRYWSTLGVEHFTRLGAQASAVAVITPQDAQDPRLADQVRQANFIYLSGGKPDYLLNTLKDSLVWQAIMEVMATGGILAGCSAGAMVCGGYIPRLPGFQPAFGLLPEALVVPHFDELPGWAGSMLRLWVGSSRRMVGVPAYTALFVEDGVCRVLGRGPVTLHDRQGWRQAMPQTTFDW